MAEHIVKLPEAEAQPLSQRASQRGYDSVLD
jgi:hypothetical protein